MVPEICCTTDRQMDRKSDIEVGAPPKNLEAIHRAREAFIASENSEKLRRTLSCNIRTS